MGFNPGFEGLMCFGNLCGTWPNHSCLSTLQFKGGSAPLLEDDNVRVITQEAFKMFMIFLYVNVKETEHLK